MTEPTSPSSSSRFGLRVVAVLAIVFAVLLWLTGTSDVEFVDLGYANFIAGPPGAGVVLVQNVPDRWSVVDPRDPDARAEIPSPVIGDPVLALGGTVYALHPDGMSMTRADKGVVSRIEGFPVGESDRLLGVLMVPSKSGAFRDVPVVGWQAPGDEARRVVWVDLIAASTGDLGDVLRPIETEGGEAVFVPDGRDVHTSRFGPSFAFVGDEGWEAWTLVGEEGEPRSRTLSSDDLGDTAIRFELPGAWDPTAVRVVAPGHRVPVAHFAPDAESLIIEGRRGGGLYTLDLLDGTLMFMAEGNLGRSRRVASGGGFRGDPPRLVHAEWSREDFLQIFETHLGGGGRMGFKFALMHNYRVALNPSGTRMAYAVASFDETGNQTIVETLYAFDYGDPSRGALELATRAGAWDNWGPLFVDDDTLVWKDLDGLKALHYSPEPLPDSDP